MLDSASCAELHINSKNPALLGMSPSVDLSFLSLIMGTVLSAKRP